MTTHSRTRRSAIVLARVSRDYDPGYPRRLSAAEFRELVAPRLPPRILRAAATASIAFSLAACEPRTSNSTEVTPVAPKDPPRPKAPDDLEARILAIIDRMRNETGGGFWFPSARFARNSDAEARLGVPQWVAHVPISYGNSYNGIFDVRAARNRAAAIFAAFGIEIERDVRFQGDALSAHVDGYDQASGLGFELRDRAVDESWSMFGATEHGVKSLDPATHLGDDELRALRDAGHRIHVADPQDRYDGDELTPGMSYLASIVEYLNENTDGPDFDIATLLCPGRDVVTVRAVHEPARTVSPGSDGWIRFDSLVSGRVILEVAPATIVKIEREDFDPRDEFQRFRAIRSVESIAPTIGRPTSVSITAHASGDSEVRLVQDGANGAPRLVVDSTHGAFVLPSSFDATAPFRIEFSFGPGEVSCRPEVRIASRRE